MKKMMMLVPEDDEEEAHEEEAEEEDADAEEADRTISRIANDLFASSGNARCDIEFMSQMDGIGRRRRRLRPCGSGGHKQENRDVRRPCDHRSQQDQAKGR